MTQGIEGKVVVTAGASIGPGGATARHLASLGFAASPTMSAVILVAGRRPEP